MRHKALKTHLYFQDAKFASCSIAALLLALLATVASAAPGDGAGMVLRLAAWNLEQLDDTDGAGCVPRRRADYERIRRQVERLGADIVAFQEVENATAARRVFPESGWNVEVSRRPSAGPGRPCRERRTARLGRLATGFAIRKGIPYRRLDDFAELAGGNPGLRWGVEILVRARGRELRLLSVHLKSGCWGAREDRDAKRRAICAVLGNQFLQLRDWASLRRSQGAAYVILGDFNRRLAMRGDWAWRTLSKPPASMRLATSPRASQCDRRFPEFIDHIVAGGDAESMLLPGSFRESPRQGAHPDHCAISADFRP